MSEVRDPTKGTNSTVRVLSSWNPPKPGCIYDMIKHAIGSQIFVMEAHYFSPNS